MFSKVQALGTLLCCFWDNACEAAHFEGIYGGGEWLTCGTEKLGKDQGRGLAEAIAAKNMPYRSASS